MNELATAARRPLTTLEFEFGHRFPRPLDRGMECSKCGRAYKDIATGNRECPNWDGKDPDWRKHR